MSSNVDNFDYLFRVIIIGDSAVGKTNLLMRYVKNEFDSSSQSTIGVDFFTKTIQIDSKIVKVQIWDTAGQDRFKSISTAFYRGSSAALLIYDITNYNTFINVQKWLDEFKRFSDTNVVLMLVGNKLDLKHQRAVSVSDARLYAEKNSMSYIETSALDSTNVEVAFIGLIKEVYAVHSQFKDETAADPAEAPSLVKSREHSSRQPTSRPISLQPSLHKIESSNSKCC